MVAAAKEPVNQEGIVPARADGLPRGAPESFLANRHERSECW
jgi:hypothetical protein